MSVGGGQRRYQTSHKAQASPLPQRTGPKVEKAEVETF